MRFLSDIVKRGFSLSSTAKEAIGNVYIWDDKAPVKLELPEKAKRVSLGQRHNAIIGESGNLYTYGSNKHGQLGHGDQTDIKIPKLVDYFQKKNIKVKEALCGEQHTIVLTEEGHVYTFGHGGRKRNALFNLFVSNASPLGHGNQESIFTPARVRFFDNIKIKRITAGGVFNFAVDESGKIYYWGCGEYGVSGDGSTKNCSVPSTIEQFEYFQQEEKISIQKIKSCSNYSVALMTNGILYGWGSNHAGQIGIKNEIGIELHETVNYPHEVIREGYEGTLVKNFDVSENMMIFELENNNFWWCGKHYAFKPEKINFEESGNIKLFAAGFKSFAMISNSNNIYTLGSFIPGKGEEDLKTSIVKLKGEDVFAGEIVGIGGEYQSKYALIA